MEVPASLIARRQACADASESAAAAASAREKLSAELDAASAALADAEHSASGAALAIVLAESEGVAARLDAAQREVWRLTSQLRGLEQLFLPTGANRTSKPVQLSSKVQAALPNHRHRRLLRARHERPSRRSAEQAHELAPSHVEHWSSHASDRRPSGRRMPPRSHHSSRRPAGPWCRPALF
jgi:hypothetical protein